MGIARRALVVLVCLGIAACARQSSGSKQGRPAGAHFTATGSESDPDVALSLELANEAYRTLQSTAFQQNLAALARDYPAVFARSHQPDLPMERVAELMKGKGHFSRVRITLVGDKDPHDPKYYYAGTGVPRHPGDPARISLGMRYIARYRDPNVVERSCAINVMAHEIAHTVSLTPVIFTGAFQDTVGDADHIVGREGRSAVGSYLIGTVAQCTWLEAQGRIPAWAVSECVRVFGVRSFNSLRCSKFGADAPVQVDALLPRAADPL